MRAHRILSSFSASVSILIACLALPSVAAGQSLDAATAASARTGKPLLVIAGSVDCVYCIKMANELATDPKIRSTAGNFVVLKLDTASPQYAKWSQRYQVEGSGIPKVFVVRADGEQIYGGTGAPTDLSGFLKRRLENAGKIPNEKELVELHKAARSAQQAVRRRDFEDAVRLIALHADDGTYAAPATALRSLADDLGRQATARLEESLTDLGSDERMFDGARSLVELQRVFGRLPGLGAKLESVLAIRRLDASTKTLLEQAAAVDAAEQFEKARDWKRALAAFRAVTRDFPDSPAAEFASRHIPELEKRSDTASAADDSRPSPVAADEKKAAAKLRFAKILLRRNPSKADDYLREAVELAPGSEVAEEARKLLDR